MRSAQLYTLSKNRSLAKTQNLQFFRRGNDFLNTLMYHVFLGERVTNNCLISKQNIGAAEMRGKEFGQIFMFILFFVFVILSIWNLIYNCLTHARTSMRSACMYVR